MIEDDFYATIKFKSGEEIFAKVAASEEVNRTVLLISNPIIMLQSPVTMKMLSNGVGQYVKIKPWLEIPEEDIFLIKYDKIVTMTEIKDKQMIEFYNRFLNDNDLDIEIDGKVNINQSMGLLTTVEEARQQLEKIYNSTNNHKES